MSKEENFPIDNDLVYKFNNIKLFDKSIHENGNAIFINFSMVRMQIAWIVPKLLFARGLADATGAKPFVFTWNKNEQLTCFFSKFGIEHISLESLNKRNVVGAIKSLFKTLSIMEKKGNILQNMTYKKICVGDSIYEDILRTSNLSTIKKVNGKICLKKIFHLLWTIDSIDKISRKKKVKYAIIDDVAYHEGAFIKIFNKYNAKIIASNNVTERDVFFDENGNIERSMAFRRRKYTSLINEIDNTYESWVDNFLKERFKGNNGRDIDRGAFKDKRIIDRNTLYDEYSLDSKKKNIIIMAHTFTDAVFNYGKYYFRDYYDWLESTLSIASSVKNVNWILKPHPTRHAYNEQDDSIENMFIRYKTDNIHMLSDEVSAESIKNIADVIVTIGGNAGAEFACFGVPVIIVGRPYYSGWGFTTEPKSYEEYVDCLKNIATIRKLDKEQIQVAKKVFYIRNRLDGKALYYYDDAFAVLLNKEYKKMTDDMALSYFAGNEGTIKYNNNVLQSLISYIEKNDITESDYYKKGTERGRE